MKAFLFLVLLTQQGLHYEKIPIKNYTNCDAAYESKATWYNNPKFKDGNGGSGVFIFTTINQL